MCVGYNVKIVNITFRSVFDSKTSQRVAIKKLSKPFANETYAKRAFREIKLMKMLNHKNVSEIKTFKEYATFTMGLHQMTTSHSVDNWSTGSLYTCHFSARFL